MPGMAGACPMPAATITVLRAAHSEYASELVERPPPTPGGTGRTTGRTPPPDWVLAALT